MAKKKTDNTLALMHPDLPFDDRTLENSFGDTPVAKNAQTPDFAAQLAELSANMKKLEERNSALERTNMALMGQPTQQVPQFGSEVVDLENLPDPVTDAKAYAQEIIRRGDAVLQTRQQKANWQQQQQQELQAKVDGIWTQFGKAYPGYAGNSELVEYAATKAVAAAKAQGMDVNKYMFSATPAFFNDVVSTLKDLGVKEAESEQDDDTTTATRTAGIAGGLESGGALTQGKDPDEVRIPTLMEELRGWKEKTGFYA